MKTYDVIIAGLGKTGLATARYLFEQGIEFAVVDTREKPALLNTLKQELPDVRVYTGSLQIPELYFAKQIILSPGIDRKEKVIADAVAGGAEVIGDIELFCREAKAPILAVTGSNGKSTVVTLLAKMIEDAGYRVGLGGNIGTPALDLLRQDEVDFYVLELSSFQLESTFSMNAEASVVLNVTQDHMDRYVDMQAYAESKSTVYRGDGCQVINVDDSLVRDMQQLGRETILFSGRDPKQGEWGIGTHQTIPYLKFGCEPVLSIQAMKIKGRHNHLNALACLAMGSSIGLPLDSMIKTLRGFTGLPHRCEWVSSYNGVEWINDSKGTNVGASYVAIEAVAADNNVILIAGGDGKGMDFSPLCDAVKGRVKQLVTIGKDGPAIAETLKGLVPQITALDMNSAVQSAHHFSKPGDVILLSPACSSLDMYTSYEQRGQAFIDAVRCLEADS